MTFVLLESVCKARRIYKSDLLRQSIATYLPTIDERALKRRSMKRRDRLGAEFIQMRIGPRMAATIGAQRENLHTTASALVEVCFLQYLEHSGFLQD